LIVMFGKLNVCPAPHIQRARCTKWG